MSPMICMGASSCSKTGCFEMTSSAAATSAAASLSAIGTQVPGRAVLTDTSRSMMESRSSAITVGRDRRSRTAAGRTARCTRGWRFAARFPRARPVLQEQNRKCGAAGWTDIGPRMQTTRRWVPTGFRARTAPGPPADAPPGSPVPVPRSLHSADTVRRDVSIQLALVLLGVVAFAIGILPLGDRYGAVSKLIGGSSSLGAVCYVAWCYRVRCWRRYPNQLLMWRALATGIASATIFATAALELSFPPRELPGRFCPSLAASANPLLVQFGFLAHEGWALVMALDVFLLMQDPFTDNANLQRIYHLLVWGGSALFTCWLAWGTRACAWGLAPTLRYGFAYLSDSEAPPPPMPPGFPPSALDSSLPLLRLEPSREELFRIEAQYCLHTWGGVPPPHDLRAADLLHTSCALNQSDTARFVCAALDAARAHANRTNAPWGDELQQGVCDVGALPPGESGGGGGSAAEGDPELPFGQRVCVGSATLFKPIHTLPVECWERTGIWSERVRRGEGDAAGGAGGGRAVDTGGGKRRGGGRWTLGDGAWALVAFAWAPLFGLVSLLLIVALGWTMNGASTRAMRAREAAISRNVDSVFHNQFLCAMRPLPLSSSPTRSRNGATTPQPKCSHHTFKPLLPQQLSQYTPFLPPAGTGSPCTTSSASWVRSTLPTASGWCARAGLSARGDGTTTCTPLPRPTGSAPCRWSDAGEGCVAWEGRLVVAWAAYAQMRRWQARGHMDNSARHAGVVNPPSPPSRGIWLRQPCVPLSHLPGHALAPIRS